MTRYLIVNADDFGLSVAVNDAVERAHREGILTSASLMVGAPAAADAVARAWRNPELRVGLHVTVVDGRPVAPPPLLGHLLDARGRLPATLLTAGLRFACHRQVRRELEHEIAAQFEAFVETGLPLDHVNAHKHMHLHPFVAARVVEGARQHGAAGLRAVVEPAGPIRRADGGRGPGAAAALLRRHARRMRRGALAAGCLCNHHLFGLAWTGGLTERRLLGLVPNLPDGVCELYGHPALAAEGHDAAAYETAALVAPAVREALARHEVVLTTYSQLAAMRAGADAPPMARRASRAALAEGFVV